jgi:hypothetical protein
MNDVARQLLASETKGQAGSEELAGATERVCRNLARYLSRVVGRDGSHALLSRSLKQAQQRCPLLLSVRTNPGTLELEGLSESLKKDEPATTFEICIAMIESFLALLASFVGEDLARKLVETAFVSPGGPEATNNSDKP